ncbi:MAG: nucleotide sugar epimerase, partial [Akkermansiaceae bacterium]|nr:nucleotide sugar epimerase [Akkermansiaceae bacterium]
DDIARGTVSALGVEGYEIINLGGGNEPFSINAMIALFEEELGRKAVIDHQPFHGADMKDTSADVTKARELLGWEAQVAPEEGFRRTVRWHLENVDVVGEMGL